ncbi:unnamed protein product, partial [Ectocarpus fasciculatus]
VLLDLWHAENRLAGAGCKQHGAFYAFLAHLRDAFAVPHPILLQKAKDIWKMRHPTWTDQQVDEDMRNNYTNKVLKYVPRTVPPAPVLLDRFDSVMDAFENVRDAKTGNLFFTDRLKKAIANLRVHIKNGCLSDLDPRDVQLYFWAGRTVDGVDKYRCARGTSNTENYHKRGRDLMSGSGTSPRMAHSVLLQHNYRRNHRSAAKHRGIAAVLVGWYAHYLLDDLQEITRGWYANPLYPGWNS